MVFFAPSSATLKLVMYPSSFKMRAISAFSLEAGTSTFGWRAWIAFRTRVSMSAMGSLVIFLLPQPYQLAFTTPGISPFRASWRKHKRQMPNLRRNARGRPQRQQRLRCRHRSLGVFALRATSSLISRAIFAVVDISLLLTALLPERHSHLAQQRHTLGVRARRGGDGYIHALGLFDLGVIDFRENQLVLDSQRVIAAAVEALRGNAAEVADAGQSHIHQPVEKLVHAVAAQCYHAADRLSFAQLELGDGFGGLRDYRLLTGDLRELVHRAIHQLGVLRGFSQTDIDRYL